MCSMLKTDFVSTFSLPLFSLDSELNFSEVNAAFLGIFGDVQGKHISDVSDEFNERKFIRKINAGQAYRFKIFAADDRKTPYSAELRQSQNLYIGFAVEAADAAKAEAMLASYSEMMEKQNRILKAEKTKSEKLLQALLPAETVEQLQSLSGAAPKTTEKAGLVMFALPHASHLSEGLDAQALFTELDELFTCFDLLSERYSCERLEVTGERYLAALPLISPDSSSCEALAHFALDVLEVIKLRHSQIHIPCRIGLHIGELMTGVVGKTQLSFTAIGTGITKVTELASHADDMQINCSEAVYRYSGPLMGFLHQHTAVDNAGRKTPVYRLNPDFGSRDIDQLQDCIIRAKTLRRSF